MTAFTQNRYFDEEAKTIPQYHMDAMVGLFASCVVAVAFRFWPVFSLSGPLSVMFFAFLYADKHPLVFLVNATAKQSLNDHNFHSP